MVNPVDEMDIARNLTSAGSEPVKYKLSLELKVSITAIMKGLHQRAKHTGLTLDLN